MKASMIILYALMAQGVAQATGVESTQQKRCPYAAHVEKYTDTGMDEIKPSLKLEGNGVYKPFDQMPLRYFDPANAPRKEWI
jgi:hypothetical protein